MTTSATGNEGRRRRQGNAVPPAGRIAPTRRTVVLRWLFVACLVACLLPKGSVHLLATTGATAAFALVVLAALLTRGEPDRTAGLFRAALAYAIVFGGWILLQSVSVPGNPLANGLWSAAGAVVGPLPGAISVNPADTRDALFYVLLPMFAFLGALVLFDDDRAALFLLRALAAIGAAVAAVGVLQFELTPERLLLYEKRYYLDSVTGVFVNRNTAATFFGCTILVLAGLLSLVYDGRGEEQPATLQRRLVLLGAGLAAVVLALFMTKSRAGAAATVAALVTGVLLHAGFKLFRRDGDGRSQAAPRWKLALQAAGGVAAIGLVSLLLSGKVGFRMAAQGLDDGRFCVLPGIVAAARENLPSGTGFGTFREVFPAYRDAACGLYGLWDRAHNGYLELAIGIGWMALPAILVPLGVLTAVFAAGLSRRRRYRVVPIVGACVLLLVALHATIDFSLQIPGMAVFAAAILAACATVSLGRPVRPPSATGRDRRPSRGPNGAGSDASAD